MMKKILFTLLSLLCCMTAAWAETGDGSQADDDVIEVGDWETLKETIQNDNAAKVRLTDDIAFRGLFGFLCTDFKGEIHGQGYAISGSFFPLFESMTDATIENVIFKDFFSYSEEKNYGKFGRLGGIALAATGCTFHDITLDNFYVESHNDGTGVNQYYTGAFVGVSESCNFENVIVKNSTIIDYDECAGGLVGSADNTKFVRCEVDDQTGIFCDGSYHLNAFGEIRSYVGGFAGQSTGSSYVDCINSALVAGDGNRIGGFVGNSSGCQFLRCVNTGLVMGLDDDDFYEFLPKYRQKEFTKCEFKYNGKTYIAQFLNSTDADKAQTQVDVGGIVGWQLEGITQIHQCANYGAIYASDTSTGGIVGYFGDGTIYNCLSVGPVNKGGTIAGRHVRSEMRNCVAVTDDLKMCGSNSTGEYHFNFTVKDSDRDPFKGEMTVTSKEMKSGLVARYLNDNNTTGVTPWRQNLTAHDGMEVDLFPTLDPTHDEVSFESMASSGVAITNLKDLIAFAKQVNEGEKNQFACAHLEADIDMSEVENWTPIGSKETFSQYRGCFDGRGHTIRNLKVSGSAAAGLFGVGHVGAEIRNLIIGEGSVITSSGDEGAGGIIGRVNINWDWGYVRIENCGSYADINVNKHGGGIFGRVWTDSDTNFKLYVNDCWSMGTITAENGNSGLLCGYTKDHGVVSNCWSGGQLRNGTNKGIWPYSIENDPDHPVAECLVGYNRELNIKGCSIVNPDDNVDKYKEDKAKYPLQKGVEIISDESARSGELCYRLNKGVIDGTQTWYQTIGKDSCPVRTKLTDGSGTDIVFGIFDSEGNITGYGNTSHDEIIKVILGIWDFEAHRVTDVNKSGDVDVTDVTTFTKAATMK